MLKTLSLLLLWMQTALGSSNSTYTNPIFPGFHPDPSCVFVPTWNDTLFCVTSSFLVFPGLPIQASHNLIDWNLISNALNRQEQLPGLADVSGQTGGIWAPTLRFHDDTFYVTTTLVYEGLSTNDTSKWENIIFISKNPYDADSWSIPTRFQFTGYDPSLFWDDDGTAYVAGSRPYDLRPAIDQVTVNLETGETGEQTTIWNGTGGSTPESPHMYKKDGFYYLLVAEGGTYLGHMVTIARSLHIDGPYESFSGNPILTNRNTTEYFQSVGHADLFQDSQGQWWGVALAMRLNFQPLAVPMGRETSLFPVTWNNGSWPILEPVRGTMSGWNLPISNDRIPDNEIYEITDFAREEGLPSGLVHWRFPDADSFTASPEERPNSLRLKPSLFNLTGNNPSRAPLKQTFVGRRQVDTLFSFTTEISFWPQHIEEEAGVTVFVDQDTHIDLGIVLLASNSSKNDTNQASRHFRLRAQSSRGDLQTIVPVPETWTEDSIELEIKAANATHFTFSASPALHRSQGFTVGLAKAELVIPVFTGTLLGVYATTNGVDVNCTYAAVPYRLLRNADERASPPLSGRSPTTVPNNVERSLRKLLEELQDHVIRIVCAVLMMTLSKGKRSYRACTRCRSRKIKCNFEGVGEPMKPPCVFCYYSSSACVVSSSRRSRKTRRDHNIQAFHSSVEPSPGPASPQSSACVLSTNEDSCDEDEVTGLDDHNDMKLRNPSDALQILARSRNKASTRNPITHRPTSHHTDIMPSAKPRENLVRLEEVNGSSSRIGTSPPKCMTNTMSGLDNFELIRRGVLRVEKAFELLDTFASNYHPYCPVTPASFFTQPGQLQKRDYFLLAVLLTISSRDSPEDGHIHSQCWNHVQSLLLQVLLAHPWTQTPRTVEGLLLLSEWLPHIETKRSALAVQKDHFSEGRTAWSIVGLAVRLGYSLRLDRAAFRSPTSGESVDDKQEQNRLIWMFTYLADRQISVRLGQSFWSRGPALSSNFTAKDFPSLKPVAGCSTDDYASVLYAHLDLMQILHNAHSILYSANERTQSMIDEGDYPRYLDDLMEAATAWNTNWGGLQVSPKLKSTLRISHEYLCLYINAFSFHAVVTREFQHQGPRRNDRRQLRGNKRSGLDLFSNGLMASPDARYIASAITAARELLSLITELDPRRFLCYLPSRYHLLTEAGSYGLYAAVFLYKALNAVAIRGHAQQKQVRDLSQAFILTLDEVASTEPHICHGYSVLLRELWQQEEGPQVESGSGVQSDQGVPRDHSSAVEDTNLVDTPTWSNGGGSQTTFQGIDRVNQPIDVSSSNSAGVDMGTHDLLSFENYLFKSMWPELANAEHQGDFHDLEGGLLGFDLDPLSGFEPL
ncbi:beta-xylosidase [Colletotrichum simmondsii]|uniref:Beta-xylosidase n=1 Tax=Colletotrichum simmondsii TaxID=703756 RepID=A0A135T347_9PEZI|nr:beta-xylosidase [Colletotrichum simmondsii]